jgi:hypothetical protein
MWSESWRSALAACLALVPGVVVAGRRMEQHLAAGRIEAADVPESIDV